VPAVGEYVRAVLLAAFGVTVAVLAWKASVPVVSWIMTFAGGFVALVALFGLAATAQQGWRVRSSRAR
jgi:hypothetical protein